MATARVRPDDGAVERTRERRSRAWIARTQLWRRSKLDRVRACGHHSVREDGSVALRVLEADGRRQAGFAGLATCGSVWACPVCSRKIAAGRQGEVLSMIDQWQGFGGALVLGTYTVSHRHGQALTAVWDATRDGWKSITSGKAWKGVKERFGIEHYVRVTETTHGDNGWHTHVHVMFFVNNPLTWLGVETLGSYMLKRWTHGIGKHGFAASAQRGVDLRNVTGPEDLADYFVKQQSYEPAAAAAEMTRADLKAGRSARSRTPFEILADAIVFEAPGDWALWAEWEKGSKGRRQMGFSRGSKEFFRLTDRTDEELAEETIGSSDDDVLVLPRETVTAMRPLGWRILNVAEVDGPEVVRLWLAGNGFAWSELPPARAPGSGRPRAHGAVASRAALDVVRRRRGMRPEGLRIP